MSKKNKWIALAAACLLAGTAYVLLGHSSGSSASQRVNALLDDGQAVGIRVLELPLFMLLALAAIAGVVSAVVVERFARRTLKPARIALVTAVVLALFSLAFAADRRINRLQNQISELRGKLNAQRMTMTETPEKEAAPAIVAAPASIPAVAATSAPATAPTSAAATAVSLPPAARDKLLVDPEEIKKTLTKNFINPTLRPVILDRASDAFELRIANPQVVAYVSITDLKTPGVEVQFGGNLSFKTYTSEFARTNDCSIAINGEAGQAPQANSGFGLWRGHMMSNGKTFMTELANNPRPFLSFDKLSNPTFTALAAKDRSVSSSAYNVIWGRLDAVIDGTVQTANERDRQPRTAMGINKDGSRLIMLVVDGRQQQYSIGFTRAEVGVVLSAFGATNGMLCDEGGSSCLYLKKFNGIVNSPSDGEERAMYTHFGITLRNPAVP